MTPTVPPPIKIGDVAYIISPSAGVMPFVQQRVERAISNLSKLGLEVKVAPNAGKNSGYVSASIEDRISDIHTAFLDKKCSLIIASIGGNHSNQLVSKLDYDLIRSNPKTFVGYSDNTVLHLALFTQAQLQTYYGPCFLNQFGEFPEVQEYTLDNFKRIVLEKNYGCLITPSDFFTDEILDWFKNEDSTRARNMQKTDGWVWWQEGTASGWALPGAIPSINHVIGSRYMPDANGAILIIDIPEGNSMHEGMSIADVDSWLTDLLNAGVFAKVKGLVIGRPYKYDNEMTSQLKNVVLRITADTTFPILFNVDFGHTDPMFTIPYGSKILIDSTKSIIRFS